MNEPVSPDRLDQLLHVTAPREWLAAATFLGLFALLVAWMLLGSVPTTVQGSGILMRQGTVHRVMAQQPGLLKEFMVRYGNTVTAGQVVAMLQPQANAPDAVPIRSIYGGVVVKRSVAEGDLVNPGDTLLVLEPSNATLQVVLYMPLLQGRKVRQGMNVQVSPSTAPRDVYGFLLGTVRWVAHFPSPESGMLDTLGDQSLVQYFLTNQTVPIEIHVDLERDPNTPSGYAWSSSHGPPGPLSAETLCTATVVLSSQRPLSLLVPGATRE